MAIVDGNKPLWRVVGTMPDRRAAIIVNGDTCHDACEAARAEGMEGVSHADRLVFGQAFDVYKALTAWRKWFSARLDRLNNHTAEPGEDYTGYEMDLLEALNKSDKEND